MADNIEFFPGDELMSALQGALENIRPDQVQDIHGQVLTNRDWLEEVLVHTLSEALKELGKRILNHDDESDNRKTIVHDERLSSDLAFRSWIFSPRLIDRFRLLGLIRWYLPGPRIDKTDGRHIAELLVWRLWDQLSQGVTVYFDGVALCLKGDNLEIKMLVSVGP